MSASNYEIPLSDVFIREAKLLDCLYSERVRLLASNVPFEGDLDQPDGCATARSRICGSQIKAGVKLKKNRIWDFRQNVRACMLGTCSASILGRNIIGVSKDELFDVRSELSTMLKTGGPPPRGKWSDLALLYPARDHKARHPAILLAFDATLQAIESGI